MSWRSVAVGGLGLALLQLLATSGGPVAAAWGMQLLSASVTRLLSPDVAGVPNRSGWTDPNAPSALPNVDPKTGVPNQDKTKPLVREPGSGYIY